MDALKDKLANISMYDVKAYVRKAQNAVFNYTEMEAKVREATNNEPWGASSTLMQEIAEGTQNYTHFHEIMPMIYKRFTEKSAEEWRQIYKALQLLEFLVKNGSERVVDYARSHVAVVDMLKHFHFIDANGKDQGINVRNRAKELMALLNDVNKIRAERKQAKANRAKFGGVGSSDFGGSSGGFGDTGSRYGGFGNDSAEYGGYAGGVYGDGGGFGGSEYEGPGYTRGGRSSEPSYGGDDFEEYQVETTAAPARSSKPSASRTAAAPAAPAAQSSKDLFSFDDEDATPSYSAPAAAAPVADDDDFADFQSAAPSTSSKPLPSKPTDSLADLFAKPSTTSSLNFSQQSTYTAPSAFSSGAAPSYDAFGPLTSASKPAAASAAAAPASSAAKPKPKADDAFSSLWTSSKTKTTGSTSAPLSALAQKNAESKMWGGAPANNGNSSNGNSSNNNGGSLDLLSL